MKAPIRDNKINRVLLKPRFRIERPESKENLIDKFRQEFSSGSGQFLGRIVDHHIIIDISKEEEHFWSPQLHAEVELDENNTTFIKGIFGPRPNVWSLFMFIHFAVALAFMVFAVIFYTRWNLGQDYTFAMIMCGAMVILWFVLYFMGQLGKRKGYEQMLALDKYMSQILDK